MQKALEIREGHRSSGFRLEGWEVPDNGGRADIPGTLTAPQELSKTLHTGWTVSQYKVTWDDYPHPNLRMRVGLTERTWPGWWVGAVSILGTIRLTGGPRRDGSEEKVFAK